MTDMLRFNNLSLKVLMLVIIYSITSVSSIHNIDHITSTEEKSPILEWSVELNGVLTADECADKYNFINYGLILDSPSSPKLYHFKANGKLEPNVVGMLADCAKTAVQQFTLPINLMKRSEVDFMEPKDPYWHLQWHLKPGVHSYRLRAQETMNVMGAWGQGYTGEGVVIAIVDDGFDYRLDELSLGYKSNLSYNYLEMTENPLVKPTKNSHGTSCAGVAAAAKDGNCGVGVAYNASLVGIRIIGSNTTHFSSDLYMARALSHKMQNISIYSNSWGPSDSGDTFGGPGILSYESIQSGLKDGRGGRGAIYVFAAGNGKGNSDNCGGDGWLQNIGILGVSAVSADGNSPSYAEGCSAVLISAFSSGEIYMDAIVTSSTVEKGSCTGGFGGTSAACPAVSGIIALMLQANPELSWRDVHHILAYTGRKVGRMFGWKKNGIRLWFNEQFGFGLIDAEAAVNRARIWKNVGEMRNCSLSFTHNYVTKDNEIHLNFNNNCSIPLYYIEHVQLIYKINSTASRGGWKITLESPSGTQSILMADRKQDYVKPTNLYWYLKSTNFWGEYGIGTWKIRVIHKWEDVNTGSLNGTLYMFGTEMPALGRNEEHQMKNSECIGKESRLGSCDTCKHYRDANTTKCERSCKPGTLADKKTRICRNVTNGDTYIQIINNQKMISYKINGTRYILCTSYIPSGFRDKVCTRMGYKRSLYVRRNKVVFDSVTKKYIYYVVKGLGKCKDCIKRGKISYTCHASTWIISCTNTRKYNKNRMKECASPNTVTGGVIIGREGIVSNNSIFKHGDKIIVKCEENRISSGRRISTCLDGRWNRTLSCRKAKIGDAKLSESVTGVSTGKVSVYYEESFQKVCSSFGENNLWSYNEGLVACKQMGYDGYTSPANFEYKVDNDVILPISFSCMGTETTLSECTQVNITGELYSCNNVVTAICTTDLQNKLSQYKVPNLASRNLEYLNYIYWLIIVLGLQYLIL